MPLENIWELAIDSSIAKITKLQNKSAPQYSQQDGQL